MKIEILSLFPEYFKGPFDESIIKRAREGGIIAIEHTNVRDFALDRHKSVDDRPFGGGAGMVLKPEPLLAALKKVKKEKSHVVYLSPRGKLLTTRVCQELAHKEHLVFIAGHYEGIDERVLSEVDEEISIGDYVLTNGCLAAIVVVDAVVRFVPGVLGDSASAASDSFSDGLLEHAHYTRPALYEGLEVPKVLLEGDHAKIASWRKKDSLQKTLMNREDLYVRHLGKGIEGTALSLILEVAELAKSVRFYQKVMGFVLEKWEGDRAIFLVEKRRLMLVEGASNILKPMWALHRLGVSEGFKRMERRLEEEAPFFHRDEESNIYCRDRDGHLWMIYFCKDKENNNG